MSLVLLAIAQLIVASFGCMSSAAASGHALHDMTLLNSHSSVIQPRPSAGPLIKKNLPRTEDAFALTPAELRLAIQRKESLEEARDANADARRIALEFEREMMALQGEVTHEGLLLRFGDASFEKDTTQLNRASRDRLDRLVDFLRKHPKQALTIRRFAQGPSDTDTHRRLSVGRTAAVEHYLLRSGVTENRLVIAITRARNGSIANGDEWPVIYLLIADSTTS